MAGIPKTAQEIMVEQLARTVTALTNEKKAKESAILELNTQLQLAERALPENIAALDKLYADRREVLARDIAPLEDLRDTCHALKREILVLQQNRLDEVAAVRAAAGPVLKAANDQLNLVQAQQAKIETAIAVCKEKVAAL